MHEQPDRASESAEVSKEAKTAQETHGATGNRHRRRERRRHAGHQTHQSPGASAQHPEASINMDELREVVELIAAHGFTDFELEREGFRVRLRRELAPQIVQSALNSTANTLPLPVALPVENASAAPSAAQESAPPKTEEEENLETIASPIVGTFYRAPAPNAEPFVKVGSVVEPDTVVCIVEAMKLMNEIQAETTGTIAKIYVENGQPVEYGQPLFGIKR